MVEINEGLILGIAGLAWIAYRLGVLWRAPRPNLPREVVVNLFFLYMVFVVHLTFFPMLIVLYAYHPDPPNLIPLVKTLHMLQGSIRVAGFNILGNLALLVPLGLFLPLLSRSYRRLGAVLLAGFLTSLGIELMQYFLAVRVFDVDDLLLNTLGAGLGYGLYRALALLPGLSPWLDRLLAGGAREKRRGLILYGLFVLSAFLSIFVYQLLSQTQTPQGILGGFGETGQTVHAQGKFANYFLVHSAAQDQTQTVTIFRRVIFGHYAPILTMDLTQLQPDGFAVSGISIGGKVTDYFVVARSLQRPAAMTSAGREYALLTGEGYSYAHAALPTDREDAFFSFAFVDAAGNDLGLAQAQ